VSHDRELCERASDNGRVGEIIKVGVERLDSHALRQAEAASVGKVRSPEISQLSKG
jgi:predicted XRE-type DNA-binding protein